MLGTTLLMIVSFEPNAESECCRVLAEAMTVDPNNPEPVQTLASVRISQQNPEAALELLEKSYTMWKDLEFEQKPNFEFRHSCGKLFLELEKPRFAADI